MSTPFKFVAEFPTDPETFWKLFWHDPYNVELYDRIAVKERRYLEKNDHGDTLQFQLRVIPRRDLPGFLQKIVGGDLGYTEKSTWFKKENRIECDIVPTLMSEKSKIRATYTITPIGEKRIRRVFEGTIDIGVPLIGRKVEQFIVGDMEKAYLAAAATTKEWLARGFTGA